MVKLIKKIIFKAYVIGLMVFAVWYGYFMYPLIFGFEGKEEAVVSLKEMGRAGTKEEEMFVRLIAEQTQNKQTDLGYRVIDQPYIEGRFHHIGFTIQEDKASICVRCHGNIPHDKPREKRSFLNMHTFYLACETCHSLPEKASAAWNFRWYDKETGEIAGNPVALVKIEDMVTKEMIREYPVYGDYGVKIAPTYTNSSGIKLLHGKNEMAFAERYQIEQNNLTPEQKSQMQETIHRKVSKEPAQCKNCHLKNSTYIPFGELGYPPLRIAELTNVAVVKMLQQYKEFHLPRLLYPSVVDEK